MKAYALKRWLHDEDGAVTVDWVVLTAAVVGLGIASVAAVSTGTGSLGTSISDSLSNASVAALGTLGTGDGSVAAALRELLAVDESTYAGWLEELAGYDDAMVASLYATWTQNAVNALDAGDRSSAGYAVDAVATIAATMTERGIDIPGDLPGSEELDARFLDMDA
ncbi:hypothetical protein [Pararhodobacter zhoushanensis]|uniref:Uncharacterized protein n=1 Tax=Pararhodobacter zhoushanensis TaxID=2479545 RepID=A0ABT3H4Z8_9RHOB|nr:hypothetical protein [Pararhodobacter zhoushanensis]MCW1934864.1 hypothetical protein [Pararhodobacter zhoushanensis]